ncbi:ankyrin repeat domain-containing protein 26-like [Mesocricetus auratus]|uniref:Ankyrin repeat domain-containing protein 26-like n=1 Tax=Mesocricetus auratus TaxID=10036 RepID=A0ABM2WE20_MESAU|nr:ankyrin repeat domain-containing protein 26-like [Mesocricetus auratus]
METSSEGAVLTGKVEEERKQETNEGEASGSRCAAALDHGDGGSPLTRKNGKPDSQQIPGTDSKERDGASALNIKEEQKRGHEKWSSGDFVTELTSEETELAADPKVKDTWSLNDSNPNKGRLQAECSEAEVTIQEQGKKIAELWKLHAGLAGDKEEQLKKLNKIISSLKCSLNQKKNKNEELEREFTEIKKHLEVMRKKLNDHENRELSCHKDLKTKELEVNTSMDMMKNEIHELKEKWRTINAKYLTLNVQFKYIEQELLSIKIAQTLYEKIHNDQKILEKDAVDMKHQLQENMAKLEDKKHAKSLKDSNSDLVISQMELRIKSLESELKKMEAGRESDARKVEKYKQCCVKERELSKILSQKLNKTNSKLSKVRADTLLVTEQNRAMQSALSTRPVTECPSATKHNTCVECNPSFIPSRNPEPSSSIPQPSESMRRSLLKKQQKMAKDIAEEVDKATAELECWSLEAYPSGFK